MTTVNGLIADLREAPDGGVAVVTDGRGIVSGVRLSDMAVELVTDPPHGVDQFEPGCQVFVERHLGPPEDVPLGLDEYVGARGVVIRVDERDPMSGEPTLITVELHGGLLLEAHYVGFFAARHEPPTAEVAEWTRTVTKRIAQITVDRPPVPDGCLAINLPGRQAEYARQMIRKRLAGEGISWKLVEAIAQSNDKLIGEGYYVPHEAAFTHEGMLVTNPLLSHCMRYIVDPIDYYGESFLEWVTGDFR